MQGKRKAKEAIAQLQAGSPEALDNIISEMFEDEEFRDTLEKMVSEINACKLQNHTTTTIWENRDNSINVIGDNTAIIVNQGESTEKKN